MWALGLYTGVASRCLPWRHVLVSSLDVWICICVIISASAFLWFARATIDDPAVMANYLSLAAVSFTVVPLPACLYIILNIVWGQTRLSSFPYLGLVGLD